MIREYLNQLPAPIRYLILGGLVIVIIILIWLYGTRVWNGVGNYLFHRQANQMSEEVQKKLAQAEEQKKELEKTLLELKQAKDDLAKAQKAREEAEKAFDDKSKTASQKLDAFKKAMSDAPVHTDTTGVTTDDLCARAKANGSDPAVIAALCTR
jgi:uncharacterized protein YlxW (UPF0749 family)